MVFISINLRSQECMRYLDKSFHNSCGLWKHSICMTSPCGLHVLSQQLCLNQGGVPTGLAVLCVWWEWGESRERERRKEEIVISLSSLAFSVANSILKRYSIFLHHNALSFLIVHVFFLNDFFGNDKVREP